jgi:hypothetical protein
MNFSAGWKWFKMKVLDEYATLPVVSFLWTKFLRESPSEDHSNLAIDRRTKKVSYRK